MLCITDGLLIMLYKKTSQPVINAFKFDQISTMYLAENVSSAAALQLRDETAAIVGKSHLIIESPSMGLIMRYVVENNFATEIDFCSEVEITTGQTTEPFFFQNLPEWRQQEANEYSSGVIRSVHDVALYELVSTGMFSSDEWENRKAVLTNIGVFLFDSKNHKAKPKFLSWAEISEPKKVN